MAKEIVKLGTIDEFLEVNQNNYLEEILLEGYVIGYSKIPFKVKEKYIKDFIPKIQNWLICDTFCSTIKVKKNEYTDLLNFLQTYLKSKKEFELRFGIVMLLDNFITDDYVDQVIVLLDKIKSKYYYTNMAKAWTLAEIGIKYWDKLMLYFSSNHHLDDFTYNKTLQKMIESYRIKDEKKEILRKMKKVVIENER